MKKMIAITSIIAMTLAAGTAFAKNYKFVFWYPGEAGSTAEAAPVLEDFFAYISKKTGDKFTGKYFNSIDDGLNYIKTEKPDFGIVSWIALQENLSSLPVNTTAAKTLPLPLGTDKERFAIIGRTGAAFAGTLFTTVPISPEFLRLRITPKIPANVRVEVTPSILSTLKKISSGEILGWALLTSTEKFTFDNMKGAWKSGLGPVMECNEIPTAPLVYFGTKPESTDRLVETLKKMKDDPESAEVLESLRLKGFL